MLTGKYQRGVPAPEGTRLAGARAAARSLNDDNFDRVEKLDAFARGRDRSLLELAFGWLLSFPCVSSVIAGATRPEQAKANVEASTMRLSADEMKEIDELLG